MLDFFTLFIPYDSIFALSGSQISAVAIDRFFLAMHQLRRDRNIMYMSTRDLYMMNQTGIFVYADMHLIPEMPCVSFLCLMRVRIPPAFFVLCRRRCRYSCRIHNRSLFQNPSLFYEQRQYLYKQLFLYPVCYQVIPEPTYGVPIWYLIG